MEKRSSYLHIQGRYADGRLMSILACNKCRVQAGKIRHGSFRRRAVAAFWLDTKRFDLHWR